MREVRFRAWDGSKMYTRIPVYSAYLDSFFKSQGYKALMQYTGLKDQNGVEIYEGDIVKDGSVTYVIRFGEGGFEGGYAFIGFYLEDRHGEQAENYHLEWNELEVIGNIYETPELLERNEE